jgi:hypothetical protein
MTALRSSGADTRTMTSTALTDPGQPLLQIAGGIATLTLARPAHHNRLHVEDLLAL